MSRRPVEKQAEVVLADVPLAERRSMVFRGTTVVGGRGSAVVVETGSNTQIGALHVLAAEAEAPPTPMERDLDQIGRILAVGATAVCAGIFGIGVLRGFGIVYGLEIAVSLGVAAIPEGLADAGHQRTGVRPRAGCGARALSFGRSGPPRRSARSPSSAPTRPAP